MEHARDALDKAMMARCVELSRIAIDKGEYPFGTVIAIGDQIAAEGINRAIRENDVSRHAEVIAIAKAQRLVGAADLRNYTLYTNVEPCAMCSFCIREARIGRVVYSLASPLMGGVSKWKILCDDEVSGRIPQVFGEVPEITGGVSTQDVWSAWSEWSPIAGYMLKRRGFLRDPCNSLNAPALRAQKPSLRRFFDELFERAGRFPARPAMPEGQNSDL
jgi:tRNA(adenine34) deaminase